MLDLAQLVYALKEFGCGRVEPTNAVVLQSLKGGLLVAFLAEVLLQRERFDAALKPRAGLHSVAAKAGASLVDGGGDIVSRARLWHGGCHRRG